MSCESRNNNLLVRLNPLAGTEAQLSLALFLLKQESPSLHIFWNFPNDVKNKQTIERVKIEI